MTLGVAMELDLNCVRSFVALADEAHFGRAAKRQNLSTSALTKRIQRLERQLGVDLIDRVPGDGPFVTASGRRFLPHARRLLIEARVAATVARRGPIRETYRLGVPGHLADHPDLYQLVAVADQLRKTDPGALVHCHGIPFPRIVSALLDDEVDVIWDVASAGHPEIESTPLTPFDRVGVVSVHHPFAEATSVSVAEFANEPMIYGLGVPAGWMGRFYLDDVRAVGDAELIAIEGASTQDVVNSRAFDRGVTVAPEFMTMNLGPALRSVSIEGIPGTTRFASRRRTDLRESVLRLVRTLQLVTSSGSNRAGEAVVPSLVV